MADRGARAIRTPLAAAAGTALILAAWAIASRLIGAEIILPTPLETLLSLASALGSPAFFLHLAATLLRALAGFGIAFALGLGWGLLSGTRHGAGDVLRPALVFIRATPVIAVILLALIWFRSAFAPIFVTWLMVLPVVVENVATGARAASGELLEMATLFRVPSGRRVRQLTVPALRPYLFASAHSGLGMAFKVTVAAEVLVQPARALGGAMQEARFYLDTPRILALTIAVVALSAVAEAALRLVERLAPGRVRFEPAGGGEATATGPAERAAGSGAHRTVATTHAARATTGDAPRGGTPAVRGVTKRYGSNLVLDDLSLVFEPGTVTTVLGPSGCGKTTLLRILAGLETPDSGGVEAPADDLGPSVAFAFQEPRLLPWAEAAANVAFALPAGEQRSPAGTNVRGWLDLVRLSGLERSLPSTLSGGMQQRVGLARALAYPAQTLLLDEPFQNLDLSVKLDLAREVRRVTHERVRTTVMVTHDVVEALATGDAVVILAGSPARVVGRRRVSLSDAERDPRTAEHQSAAAELYELLLSAR
ncbi:MAG: ATP-binding cassette domain-containing protein [Spirochaetota bacterium]